jgi:hypothetical protein
MEIEITEEEAEAMRDLERRQTKHEEVFTMPFQALFRLGMKRDVPDIIAPTKGGVNINLGAGKQVIPGFSPLDYPSWDAEKQGIPLFDNSVNHIFAFHFFEHFHGKRVIELLREVERVLVPGGVLTAVIPHRLGSMAYHDLDHKSFWTEDNWKILLSTPYYDKHRETPWQLVVGFNVIAGLVERNLAVISQLIKVPH